MEKTNPTPYYLTAVNPLKRTREDEENTTQRPIKMRRVNNPKRTSVYMRKIETLQESCLTPPTNELTNTGRESEIEKRYEIPRTNNHKTPNAKKCATKISKRELGAKYRK